MNQHKVLLAAALILASSTAMAQAEQIDGVRVVPPAPTASQADQDCITPPPRETCVDDVLATVFRIDEACATVQDPPTCKSSPGARDPGLGAD